MAITLEYLSYSGAKNNTGGGCRAVFDFQGSDGGSLYVGYTFQIGFDYEPKAAVLANNVVVEGLTGVITEVAHETASYATGKLEIYALQYGTTYEITTFDMSGTPMSDITFTPQANNSIKAKNLVSGTLANDITTSTTNILVHIADNISAQGIMDFFPTTPFYITIMPKTPANGVSNRLDSEIIKITNVGHDQVGNAALTGVRAQRDTTAKAFSTGDIVTVGVYAEDAVFLSEDGTTETETPWVGTNMIEDGAVINDKIQDGAITGNKIAVNTIPHDKMQFPYVKWSDTLSTNTSSTSKFVISLSTAHAWGNVNLIIYSRYAPLQFVNLQFDGNGKINTPRRTDNANMESIYAITINSTNNTITFSAPRTYDLMAVGEFIPSNQYQSLPCVNGFYVATN